MLVLVVRVFGGDSKEAPAPPAEALRAGGAAPKPASVKPTPEPSLAPLVFKGVDPFKPLVNTKTAASTKAAPAPAQTTQTPAGPNSAVVGGNTVTLNEIFTKNGKQKVHVAVDGTTYTAGPGDNFYDDDVLVSIADPCAQFAWRDQSFRLCVQPGSGG
jgi:hypothetical protein